MLDSPADRVTSAAHANRDGSRRAFEAAHREVRDSLPGFLSAVRQRRKTLVAVILLVPFCAWLTLQQITPLYTATGSLIYDPSEFKPRELQSILRDTPTTEAMMASQAEILHSLHIAQKVAERGNLFRNPEFNAALRPPALPQRIKTGLRGLLGMETAEPSDDPVYGPSLDPSRDRTLLAVQDALHSAAVRFSHVVEVTFVADDPLVAAAAVNNAMDTYIKDQYAAKHRRVETATA